MSLEGKLTMLAGAIRDKLGVETTFTLDELAETIGGFKLAEEDNGNWKVSCPAVNEDRVAFGIFDNGSYGIQVSYDGFEKANWNGINAFLEDGETITKSCSWTVKAPPQGGTFTLVTNCYEESNSNCYLAGVVKDKETKTFDYATLDKMKVGENGLCYKENPYNWHNKDINVDIPLEPGETCVVTFFGCVKAASKNRAALYAKRYKMVAREVTLIDGIEPVTGKDIDVTLTNSLKNDELPFEFVKESDSPAISTGGNLMEVTAVDGSCNNVVYSFTPPCDMSMYIDASVSSETNWDFGVVVIDTQKHSWKSHTSIKNWSTTISSDGYLVLKGSGEASSDKEHEIKLKAGTKYYLMACYAKDSGGKKGSDKLWIKSIRVKASSKIYHLSKHNYKMTDVFPDAYASLTDNILKKLDYTHCTTYEGMFDCCAGLTNIELDVSNIPVPDGLRNVVRGCTGLKTITFRGLTADNEGLVTGELIGNTEAKVTALGIDGRNLRIRYVTTAEIEAAKTEIKNTGKLIIPDGVEVIPAEAFMGVKEEIKAVTIPDSVKEIGEKAFYDCKFRCNMQANGLTLIGPMAFACKKKRPFEDDLEDDNGKITYFEWSFPNLKQICSGAFTNNNTRYTAYKMNLGIGTKKLPIIAEDAFKNYSGYWNEKLRKRYGGTAIYTYGIYPSNNSACWQKHFGADSTVYDGYEIWGISFYSRQ